MICKLAFAAFFVALAFYSTIKGADITQQFDYVGCFNGEVSITSASINSQQTLDPQECLINCSSEGYPFVSVSHNLSGGYYICACGNSYGRFGRYSSCSACPQNASWMFCGSTDVPSSSIYDTRVWSNEPKEFLGCWSVNNLIIAHSFPNVISAYDCLYLCRKETLSSFEGYFAYIEIAGTSGTCHCDTSFGQWWQLRSEESACFECSGNGTGLCGETSAKNYAFYDGGGK